VLGEERLCVERLLALLADELGVLLAQLLELAASG